MRRDGLCHAIRETLARLPKPYDSHYGVVPPRPPEHTIALGEYQAIHRKASDALARIEALSSSLQDPYVITRTLTRREAVSSSAIEGTNSTLDELLSLEESHDDGAKDAAHQVRDYALALERLIPQATALGGAFFTEARIAALHEAVMEHDPDYRDVPGAMRQVVVWIGGTQDIAYSTFNPPPPEFVPAGVADNLDYMRAEGLQAQSQSLIARMAIAHAHFEAVHPFRDGNGRVGRLLLPLMMAAEGREPLYLSPYVEANKAAYGDALKAAQQQLDWPKMIGFVSEAICGTVEELMATRAALRRLRERWSGRRSWRAGAASSRALDLLLDHPVITMKSLSGLLGVSVPAATTAIGQLVGAGIVQERTGYRRNRIFAAKEVLRILNRPFGADPEDEGA